MVERPLCQLSPLLWSGQVCPEVWAFLPSIKTSSLPWLEPFTEYPWSVSLSPFLEEDLGALCSGKMTCSCITYKGVCRV